MQGGGFSGCGANSAQAEAEAEAQRMKQRECRPPEEMLAQVFKDDLGVVINPQALRMFIRWRFDRLSTLAHKIHQGK